MNEPDGVDMPESEEINEDSVNQPFSLKALFLLPAIVVAALLLYWGFFVIQNGPQDSRPSVNYSYGLDLITPRTIVYRDPVTLKSEMVTIVSTLPAKTAGSNIVADATCNDNPNNHGYWVFHRLGGSCNQQLFIGQERGGLLGVPSYLEIGFYDAKTVRIPFPYELATLTLTPTP